MKPLLIVMAGILAGFAVLAVFFGNRSDIAIVAAISSTIATLPLLLTERRRSGCKRNAAR